MTGTNEERALVPQCPACGAAPGMRCLQHLTTEVYRLVHQQRGRVAGLTMSEVLRLDFGDVTLQEIGHPFPTELEVMVREARPDDLRLAIAIADAALGLAEQAGAAALSTTRLRAVLGKLGPRPSVEVKL